MGKRIDWIDQIRGFVIVMTLYVNNHPLSQKYICSFILPLILIIAGFFHPKNTLEKAIEKRFNRIMVPYFLWAFILFSFWFFIGRYYGESVEKKLSAFNNLIGVFYGQGRDYMDWGIPIWFLPMIFVAFLIFTGVRRIKIKYLQYITVLILCSIGLYACKFNLRFLWSLDIAMVSIVFYAFGFYFKKNIIYTDKWYLFLSFGIIHFFLFKHNIRVNMYYSLYGNKFLFFINAFSGAVFYIGLFKFFPVFKILSFYGKNSIVVLASQQRIMTIIKFILLFFFGIKSFEFSELEKVSYSIIQIILVIPVIVVINKYIPILNGKSKNN